MVRISQMSSRVKNGEVEGDWVTIGVVVSKMNPMDSAKVRGHCQSGGLMLGHERIHKREVGLSIEE